MNIFVKMAHFLSLFSIVIYFGLIFFFGGGGQ